MYELRIDAGVQSSTRTRFHCEGEEARGSMRRVDDLAVNNQRCKKNPLFSSFDQIYRKIKDPRSILPFPSLPLTFIPSLIHFLVLHNPTSTGFGNLHPLRMGTSFVIGQ